MLKTLNLIEKLSNFIVDRYCEEGDCSNCSDFHECPVNEAKELIAEELGDDFVD